MGRELLAAFDRQRLLRTGLLLLFWFLVFFPILQPMVDVWMNHTDNSYTHLVPLISLYFVRKKFPEINR